MFLKYSSASLIFKLLLSLLFGFIVPRAIRAQTAAPMNVSFAKEIQPIFQSKCQGCHQPARSGGSYVMTTRLGLLGIGESGKSPVVPGKPQESLLLEQIAPDASGIAEMPKDKPSLSEPEISLIHRWILEGALDDTPVSDASLINSEHPPVYYSPPAITALDFSPDSKTLAVSGYHEVLLHPTDGATPPVRFVGLSERIESIRFSPDGSRLAVAGGSPARMGELQVWNVADRTLFLSIPVTFDTIYGASWSADSSRIAFGCGDNSLRAVNATTGEQVLFQGAHNDWVLDTAFSSDSSHLVSVSRDRSMKLIEVATQRFVDNITSITPGALKGGLASVDRHPTRDELAVGGADGTPKLFLMHRPANKPRQIGDDFNLIRAMPSLPGRIFEVRYSPDGSKLVAVSSADGRGHMRVFATEDGKQLISFDTETGGLFAADFSPDGTQIAVGGLSGTIWILNANDGTMVRDFVAVPLSPRTASTNQK